MFRLIALSLFVQIFSLIERKLEMKVAPDPVGLFLYSKDIPPPPTSIFLLSPALSLEFSRKMVQAIVEIPNTRKLEIVQGLSGNVVRVFLVKNPLENFPKDPIKFLEKCAELSEWYSARGFWGAHPKTVYTVFLASVSGDIGRKATEHYTFFEKKLRVEDFQASGYIAWLCALELEKIMGKIKFPERTSYIETPWGEIVLGTRNDDVFLLTNFTLAVLDPGGDDIYIERFDISAPMKFLKELEVKGKENESVSFWRGKISKIVGSPFLVVIDGAGNDSWMSRTTFVFPFKSKVRIDMRGNDFTECKVGCAGAGFFSTGVLIDKKGSDIYRAVKFSQGAGAWGTGLLFDLEGNDSYFSFTQSQGYGFVEGSGVLFDFEGDDTYVLDDSQIVFPAFQSKRHNTSAGQGCGFGLRGDFSYGKSAKGGVGILADLSGNDRYSAGVFAQGCGYWYGLGILYDLKGNDLYEGFWYCQGSSAHFGAGVLVDEGGDDSYKCQNQAMGHGHDIGIGALFDLEGNDTYVCGMMCIGSGHANGLGIFLDLKGDDRYEWQNEPPGISIISIFKKKMYLRELFPTLSLFLDTQGKDTYEGKRKWQVDFYPENSTVFILKNEKSEVSVFLDSPTYQIENIKKLLFPEM